MGWKNQLTKTPYLVLFVILISVGVGTASSLITITLAGDVIVTDNLHVGKDLFIGDSETNQDILFFDNNSPQGERFQWDDDADEFQWSDDGAMLGNFYVDANLTVNKNATISGDLTVDGFTAHPAMYTKEDTNNIPPNVFSETVILCDDGDVSVSGGFNAETPSDAFIQSSFKFFDDEWVTRVKNPENFTVSGTWFVNCLDVTAPAHVP